MTPIEELLYRYADYAKGKAGPNGFPAQSAIENIYSFKLGRKKRGDGAVSGGARPLTAAGKQTLTMRNDNLEWPDVINQVEAALVGLNAFDRRAYYAVVGYYLERVPGRIRQDEAGLARGWRPLHRGVGEHKDQFIDRLRRGMPWELSRASYYTHLKRGEESLAAFIRGANWAGVAAG